MLRHLTIRLRLRSISFFRSSFWQNIKSKQTKTTDKIKKINMISFHKLGTLYFNPIADINQLSEMIKSIFNKH